MKRIILISILIIGTTASTQRPDLGIGLASKTGFLKSPEEHYFSLGLDLQMQVNKRCWLSGLNLGYQAIYNQSALGEPVYHTVNADVLGGLIWLRKPAFRSGLNLVCSYSVSLNRDNLLGITSDYKRNQFKVLPEVYMTYKKCRFAYRYHIPIVGTVVSGSELVLGIWL